MDVANAGETGGCSGVVTLETTDGTTYEWEEHSVGFTCSLVYFDQRYIPNTGIKLVTGEVTSLGSLTQSGTADWATPFNLFEAVATTTNGSGEQLLVDVVTDAGGAVTSVTVNDDGHGYDDLNGGDLVTIAGDLIGGTVSDTVTVLVTGTSPAKTALKCSCKEVAPNYCENLEDVLGKTTVEDKETRCNRHETLCTWNSDTTACETDPFDEGNYYCTAQTDETSCYLVTEYPKCMWHNDECFAVSDHCSQHTKQADCKVHFKSQGCDWPGIGNPDLSCCKWDKDDATNGQQWKRCIDHCTGQFSEFC